MYYARALEGEGEADKYLFLILKNSVNRKYLQLLNNYPQ
jgi:hypothetical protein